MSPAPRRPRPQPKPRPNSTAKRGGQAVRARNARDAGPRTFGRKSDEGLGGDQVEGRRAVRELLAANTRSVTKVLVASGQDPAEQLDEIEALAQAARVPLEMVSRARLDSIARTDVHQGVVALTRAIQPVDLDDLIYTEQGHTPFLLVGAGITDPRNLGALLRSAECAGVTGVVLPRHRSARLSPTVAKTAAGAIEHLTFATVAGIPVGLERMAKLGVVTIGLAGEAKKSLFDLNLGNVPVALVLGEEERGLAPLVRKRCDELVSIPQFGQVESLNVSVAGAIAMYEVARQRIVASRT
jgi:23S rRNA (guanosine2251-2'-O)-methyltransferase